MQVEVLPVPWQQPSGQVVESHAGVTHELFLHSVPGGQTWQVTPPLPQAVLKLPGWQVEVLLVVVFWQQPFGQLVGSHAGVTHEPPWHTVPFSHFWQVPPPVPQALSAVPATHPPFLSQQPVLQLSGVQRPAWHTPATHAIPAAHWLPHLPQCASFFSVLTHLPPQQVSFSSHRLRQLPQ